MPRRKREVAVQGEALFSVPDRPVQTAHPAYADQPLDPNCTVKTTFAELRVGDMVDYWGTPVHMVTMTVTNDGRTYIQCKDGRKAQFALAPDDEIVWRQPRME